MARTALKRTLGRRPMRATAGLSVGAGAVTTAAGAGTLHAHSGKITTEALATAAGATTDIVITNNRVAAADIILLTRVGGTNTAGTPTLEVSAQSAGSFTIRVRNAHATAALNGTLVIAFAVLDG